MIEETLVTTLSGITNGHVYPLIAPDNQTAPFIIYHNILNSPENTLADGVPISNTRIQIDCYAKTYAAAKALHVSLQAAMVASAISNVQLTNQDLYEPETKLYRVQQDYSIWS